MDSGLLRPMQNQGGNKTSLTYPPHLEWFCKQLSENSKREQDFNFKGRYKLEGYDVVVEGSRYPNPWLQAEKTLSSP